MFAAQNYPIEVVELGPFRRNASSCLGLEELDEFIAFLAENPERGDVIPGTGGVRKIRWGYQNRGKRGGLRIIYYFRDLNMPLFLLQVYKKGEKADLTSSEKKEMEAFVKGLVLSYSKKWLRIVRDQLA